MRDSWQGANAIYLIRLVTVSLVAYGAASLISCHIKAPLLVSTFFRSPHVPDSPKVYLLQRGEVGDSPSEGRSTSVADGVSPGAAVAAVQGGGGGQEEGAIGGAPDT